MDSARKQRLICLRCGAPAAGIRPCPSAPFSLNPPYCETVKAQITNRSLELLIDDKWSPIPEDLSKTIKLQRNKNMSTNISLPTPPPALPSATTEAPALPPAPEAAAVPPAPPVPGLDAPVASLMEQLVAANSIISSALESFLQAETLSTGCTVEQANIVAADLLNKFVRYPLKEQSREACAGIEKDKHWQASDGTVYMTTEASTIILNTKDYLHSYSRTQRPGEDRKGFTPFAKKKAEELGYKLPK